MFVLDEESHLLWFQHGFENICQDLDHKELYFLAGVVVGLAIYHSILLDVRFPIALYKKLLGHVLTLHDLNQFKPSLAHGLHQLLSYHGNDIEQTMMHNFAITIDLFGDKREIELIPRGKEISVNHSNKHGK